MGDRHQEPLDCPFCSFTTKNEDHYELMFHVETVHPESSHPSPFAVEEAIPESDSDDAQEMEGTKGQSSEYIECQCGEYCLLAEFESHLEMHYAEGMSFDETHRTARASAALGSTLHQGRASSPGMERALDNPIGDLVLAPSKVPKRSATSHRSRSEGRKSQGLVQDFIDVLRHPTAPPPRKSPNTRPQKSPHRLGRKELGPHAYEERMPEWLRRQLELGAKVSIFNQINQDGRLVRVETIANEFHGIIPVLGQLCDQDPALSRVYLCHPDVTHVVKMAKEGGFCGYRNIQMLISYIRDARSEGHQRFLARLPSIIQLQDMIEDAWDQGFNQIGRIETGGIRDTRKYIGTPEAQALLQSLRISCKADNFGNGTDVTIQQQLLKAVELYFLDGHPNLSKKVCRTSLPPIFFQHPGHSLTIVGLEVRRNGSRNLLVFDPMFKPSPGIHRLIGTQFRTSSPERLLKAYRRGEPYLKYSSYEILQLTSQVSPKTNWHGL